MKLDQKSGDLKTKSLVNRKARPFFRIMAPFKLFRMGQGSTSRSTSQENEPEKDQPANLVITTTSLNKLTNVMTSPSAHYLNIDESDQTSENSSLMSLNNDQRALLSSGSTVDQIGKLSFITLFPLCFQPQSLVLNFCVAIVSFVVNKFQVETTLFFVFRKLRTFQFLLLFY